LDSVEVYNLKKVMEIIEELREESKKWELLDKLLNNLQAYRIFKERGYCWE
jgi:hypothetical protein